MTVHPAGRMYCGVESGTAQPISLPVLAMHFESFSRQRTELWNDLVPSWIEMSENVAFAQAIGALVVVERVDAVNNADILVNLYIRVKEECPTHVVAAEHEASANGHRDGPCLIEL